jgi:hypothetical protein
MWIVKYFLSQMMHLVILVLQESHLYHQLHEYKSVTICKIMLLTFTYYEIFIEYYLP